MDKMPPQDSALQVCETDSHGDTVSAKHLAFVIR